MKEYQARTKDGKAMCMTWPDWNERGAKSWFRETGLTEFEIDHRRDYVLVLAEWESEDEANEARLRWLEENCASLYHGGPSMGGNDWHLNYTEHGQRTRACGRTVAAVIDIARGAPAPKVTRVEV